MTDDYDSAACDLCGSRSATTLVHLRTGRSMRSDQAPVAGDLRKLRCDVCGLVREGHDRPAAELAHLYGRDYAAAPPDYTFYTPGGPVPRSRLLCDWIVGAFGEHRWRPVRRCLEVGSGAGALLDCFRGRFPHVRFAGTELSEADAARARARGLDVRSTPVERLEGPPFDAIFAVAVLEHVPSPTRFLAALRRRLGPGGLLFLCQPTNEVPSYDVFFVDHLHHFGLGHLRHYARKTGYREVGAVVGHEWMPNFSLHLWAAAAPGDGAWHGPPAATACGRTAEAVAADFRRLDRTLAGLARAGRRAAVFGLNEVFALARAYSDLGRFPVACGLHDRPDDPAHARFDFPVVAPEECRRLGVEDVILAVNAVYYPQLFGRLAPLGVAVHPVLSTPGDS